jgi:hypothetical protein
MAAQSEVAKKLQGKGIESLLFSSDAVAGNAPNPSEMLKRRLDKELKGSMMLAI